MIAIKDIKEMPKCCNWDCPLAREDGGACQLEDVRTSEKERPKDCPLVEIVTCNDCKYCRFELVEGIPYYWCNKDDCVTSEDFYCANGERRE